MDLVTYMDVNGARYIVRIFDNRIPKGILEGSLGRKKLVGNPRNRWEFRVWKDAAKLHSTKNWCAVARHSDVRKKWHKEL
jgi:hypothetical protein